ncbi:MAG: peroxidase family protein, partial [Cyanobacteria bacterium J06554_11]
MGPLTTLAGQRIEIPLAATDPNGDPITYSLRSEDDLPTGKLDGSGKLTFEPTPNQIGEYTFTLVATDGASETTQQISLTVAPDPDTTTRISGQILDTNGNPLAHFPLGLGRLQAITDENGYFTIIVPETSFPTEEIDIQIPLGDTAFDPFFTGASEINLRRTTFDGTTGTSISNPLRHPNLVSTFMDASMVYGSNESRAAALRTNDGTGRLKVSENNLLPINNNTFFPDGVLPNSNRGLTDPAALFATGDVRANENIGLTAMHTVFVREHNRLADEIAADNPELSGEATYQRARKLVAAQIQHITYSEYLPLLIGDQTIPDYAGYDAQVDPAISHLFSAAAFRMGHTQSFDEFLLIDAEGQALPSVSLNDSTFNPSPVQEQGIDAILRGLYAQKAEAIDTKVLDQLRNTLFGPPGAGGIDLAAVDIQRGRDVGLPDYNQARVDFGLLPATSFADITADIDLQARLEQVYGTVDDIDAIVGGLAEDAAPGSMVGEFFQKVIADQFARLRDGDRFWYENGQFTADELSFIRETSLAALLERNTDMSGLADNLFSTGRDPAALAAGGTVAAQPVNEYATIDGVNNNLENPSLGTPGTHLRVDYTQEYGDGIRSLAGEDRANVRDISNQIFAQSESIPDSTGATGFMLTWSQFMGHDLTFAPAGAADTLKIYGTEYESATGEVFPFVAEKLNLMLGHEVYAGVNNVIERPIYLPALDLENNVQTTDASGDITVTNAELGAQVFVEANTLTDNRGNAFTGQLSISEVPPELTPAALPEGLSPDLVVTIQPGDMVFTEPARLTLPNRAGWAAGTVMNLWSINPATGEFDNVGKGEVSADGELVETIEGGIRNSSWHMLVPEPAVPKTTARNINDECEECLERHRFTSTVESHSGAVVETHDLVSYQSQGEQRGIQLTYDSLRAAPSPIIHTAFEAVETFGETYLISKLTLKQGDFEYQMPGYKGDAYGLSGGEHFWRIPDGYAQYNVAMQADLKDLASGAYQYEVESGFYLLNDSEFTGSAVKTGDRLVHVNSVDSVLGSGWGIAGVQELVENSDGSVLLIDGDGSDMLFEASETHLNQYDSPASDFSVLVKLSDGTFQRTTENQTVYRFNSDNKLVSITDRNQNITRYIYNNGLLTDVVDPIGLVTNFTYQNGRVSSITDPAGRSTQLKYSAEGDLVEIIDPDGTKRVFEYDRSHLMTAETDKQGYREQTFYDFAGRASHAVRKDGSIVRVNPVQVQGLYSPELTAKKNTAPFISATMPNAISHYADANGNVTQTLLDDSGRRITSIDGEGNTGVSRRDENYQLQSTFSAKGEKTSYKYDESGNVIEITYPGLSGNNSPLVSELTFSDL